MDGGLCFQLFNGEVRCAPVLCMEDSLKLLSKLLHRRGLGRVILN